MRAVLALFALLSSLLVCTPAVAADVNAAEQIGASGPVTIDPTKAYIAFRILQKSEFRFARLPTPEDIAQYEQDRAGALEKYKRKKPDGAGFTFDPIEARLAVNTQLGRFFDRQGAQYVYLIAVKPGTYVLYGHMWLDGPGDMETCFCMGTVKFDVAAGKVTDIGRIRMPDDWDIPAPPPNPAGIFPFMLVPPAVPLQVTGRLQGLAVEPAVFHAMGKIPEFLRRGHRSTVPLQGVLAYDRDRVIDPTTGKPVQ